VEARRQYVGIDLHRHRSVIVRRDEVGETISTVRIDNDPLTLAAEVAKSTQKSCSSPRSGGTGRPTS